MEIHKRVVPLMLLFLMVSVMATFSQPNFPDTVKIYDEYGFEIKFNDTSVEKCYLVIYNTGNEIVQYHYPVPEDCRTTFIALRNDKPYKSCVPAELYLESDGTLRFQFEVESVSFLADENYTAVVYCGDESYNATFTTHPGAISNRWYNWTLTAKANVEFIVSLFIMLGFIFVIFYKLWIDK